MDNRVYAVRCERYKDADDRLTELFAMMGGLGPFAAAGERIVLKANLLLAAPPEKAITTHPDVIFSVARGIKALGAEPVVADSPGAGYKYNRKTMGRIYRTCGLEERAMEAGLRLNMDMSQREVSWPDGHLIKRLEVITPVLEAAGVINLCKLKTHLYMAMTGAVKNSFGVIPGLSKAGYHAKLKDPERFADMLIDLSQFVAPRLTVMDAVVAMEGDGPNNGDLVQVGLLLASTNPYALDVVGGEIMGIDLRNNPVLVAAGKRGLGPVRIEDVELIGVEKKELRVPGFRVPATLHGKGIFGIPWWQKMLVPLIKGGLTVRPVIDRKTCVACGACHDACPEHAITLLEKQYASIDDDRCVRCYCCHEMCKYDAIFLKKSLLYRLLNR